MVMGQKVPIERPRVRTTGDQEVRLGRYELFHRGEPLTETVWEKLMLGLARGNTATRCASSPKRTVWRRALWAARRANARGDCEREVRCLTCAHRRGPEPR